MTVPSVNDLQAGICTRLSNGNNSRLTGLAKPWLANYRFCSRMESLCTGVKYTVAPRGITTLYGHIHTHTQSSLHYHPICYYYKQLWQLQLQFYNTGPTLAAC